MTQKNNSDIYLEGYVLIFSEGHEVYVLNTNAEIVHVGSMPESICSQTENERFLLEETIAGSLVDPT